MSAPHDPVTQLATSLSLTNDPSALAAAGALSLDEATRLVVVMRAIELRAERKRRRQLTVFAAAATVLTAGALAVGSTSAWAQACPQTLPSPMVTMCPDAPALASQVNGNFDQLITWLQQKVGTVGNANINTTGSMTSGSVSTGSISTTVMSASGTVNAATLVASGTLNGSRMVLSGGTIQNGGTAINATSDLGLYSRTAGSWIRIVTNNAPIKFFNAEGANGVGVTANFAVETNGTLTGTQGSEGEGTYVLPDAFCVIVNQNASCPTNWDQRNVKWDTEDNNNADYGKDGKIASDDGNSGSVRMRFCCRGSGW